MNSLLIICMLFHSTMFQVIYIENILRIIPIISKENFFKKFNNVIEM